MTHMIALSDANINELQTNGWFLMWFICTVDISLINSAHKRPIDKHRYIFVQFNILLKKCIHKVFIYFYVVTYDIVFIINVRYQKRSMMSSQ